MEIEALLTLFSNLGMGGIFVFLYFRNGKRHAEEIRDKTDRIRELTERLITIGNSNAELALGMAALGQDLKGAIEENTKVLHHLCEAFNHKEN